MIKADVEGSGALVLWLVFNFAGFEGDAVGGVLGVEAKGFVRPSLPESVAVFAFFFFVMVSFFLVALSI